MSEEFTGLKFAEDRNCYCKQNNDPTEITLSKKLSPLDVKKKKHLISCFPTADINAISCMFHYDNIQIEPMGIKGYSKGIYKPQPEEWLRDYFEDPRNYARMQAFRKEIDPKKWLNHTIPQFHPQALKDVLGIDSFFTWNLRFEQIAEYLDNNIGVVMCLEKPGHAIALTQSNKKTKQFKYNDPDATRHADGTGFNKLMSYNEFITNNKGFYLVIGVDK